LLLLQTKNALILVILHVLRFHLSIYDNFQTRS
jgi:hypothetical protein